MQITTQITYITDDGQTFDTLVAAQTHATIIAIDELLQAQRLDKSERSLITEFILTHATQLHSILTNFLDG